MRCLALPLAALVLALAGCGLGEGAEREGGAELRVTRSFGQELLDATEVERVREDQTVLRALDSEHEIEARFGGKFVQAIDGLAGTTEGGRHDWFYFVNGIEAPVGAADFELSPGDVVQWDYRLWEGAMRVPAIVGAWPEPFVHGFRGKRLPVRVECAEPEGEACAETRRRLDDAGAPASAAELGTPAGSEVLRVVVAPWRVARRLSSIRSIENGPERSGVFVRFEDGGRELVLLDERAEPVREAPPGSGLVAATAFSETDAVWVVTGVDDAGVLAAARALDNDTLRDAFAVAVTPEGSVELPVVEGSS